MESLLEISKLGCFSRDELKQLYSLTQRDCSHFIDKCLHNHFIERVKNDFYAVCNSSGLPVLEVPQIVSRIYPDSYLAMHSAFECYGSYNQVFNTVFVASVHRFRTFDYREYTIEHVEPSNGADVQWFHGCRVSSPEQTLVDCIDKIKYSGGLEELLECLWELPSLDENKLLSILTKRNKKVLWQKIGYLLQSYNQCYQLSANFFTECKKHLSKSRRDLEKEYPFEKIWNRDWGLYTPKNLFAYQNGGCDLDKPFPF